MLRCVYKTSNSRPSGNHNRMNLAMPRFLFKEQRSGPMMNAVEILECRVVLLARYSIDTNSGTLFTGRVSTEKYLLVRFDIRGEAVIIAKWQCSVHLSLEQYL